MRELVFVYCLCTVTWKFAELNHVLIKLNNIELKTKFTLITIEQVKN